MATQITRDEWLSALDEARAAGAIDPHPDAITVAQYAELVGCSNCVARRHLQMLEKAGRAKRVMKPVRCGDGGYRPAPAYVLVKDARKR